MTPGGGPGVMVTMQGVRAGRDVMVDASATNVLPPEPTVKALHPIPAPPADFTGRAAELADLRSSFGQGVAVSGVRGMGGVGKTALALKLAHELREAYPDAQLYIDLQGSQLQPMSVADALAHCIHAYHPTAKLPENLNELQATYRSVLDGQCTLILLDDAAGPEQVEPLLPPVGCGVLITSRRRFTVPGLYPVNLDPLPEADACALLLAICPRLDMVCPAELTEQLYKAGVIDLEGARPEWMCQALARLCGRLPIALRLTASTLAVYVDLDPVAYTLQLCDERKRLELVDAAFSLSYAQLSGELQQRWAMLSVFPGGFDPLGAAAVWGMLDQGDPESIRQSCGAAKKMLSDLVVCNLVDWLRDTGRYRLHDLARLYAMSRLSPADRARAEEGHAEHYEQLAVEANELYYKGGEKVTRGLALFDRELVNIRAGQAWAAAHSETNESAARLCSHYSSSTWFCVDLRLAASEQIRWFEAALAAARRLNDRKEEAVHLGNLGIVHEDLGEIGAAIEFYEQQLAITTDIGDLYGKAQALDGLGTAHWSLGNAQRAVEYCEQALAAYREISDGQGEALVLGNLGLAYAALGELHKAVDFHEKALAIHREMGDRRNEAVALHCLASVHGNLHETHLAISLYDQALTITSELGDHRGEAAALGGLGRSYADLGELHRAVELYEQQLKIARDINDREDEARALFNESLALDGLGERARAVPLAVGAMQIFEQIENPSAADVRRQLAEWRGE